MNDEAGTDYERSDVDAGTIGWIAAGLALFVLTVPLVIPRLNDAFENVTVPVAAMS